MEHVDTVRGRIGGSSTYRTLKRFRPALLPALDCATWAAVLYVGSLLRFDLNVPELDVPRFLLAACVGVVTQVVLGYSLVLYRTRWKVGSFEEARALALTVAGTTVVVFLYDLSVRPHPIPLSAALVSGVVVFVATASYRAFWRMAWEHWTRSPSAEPVIVYGAGAGGEQVVRALLGDPASPYRPVALLDDDPAKQNLRIRHIKVAGTGESLATVAAATGAQTVIIAIPTADSALIRQVSRAAGDAGLEVRTLPPVSRLFSSAVGVDDIRPVTNEDLLGRHRIDTKVEEVAEYLRGRRILVTGAGGSIGSELCRQISSFGPAELVMVDRDESGLHQTQLSIEGQAMLDSRSLVVCDIRDHSALSLIFDEHRPEVVFHAAALKHLALLEMWPIEAVKTNILGTINVLSEALRVGVARFVNISTDKAANPSSVLGATKRLGERLTSAAGTSASGIYLSVRFGNVLGSRGSVLIAFRHQIRHGGPVTVTHPEVTRFFMTTEEAVQLVVQAGAIGGPGEVLVLDMGAPVRIADVARQLVAQTSPPVDIVYTGLRPGEKLHEDLFGTGEVDLRPRHPLISHVPVPPIPLDTPFARFLTGDPSAVTTGLLALAAHNVAAEPAKPERVGGDPHITVPHIAVTTA